MSPAPVPSRVMARMASQIRAFSSVSQAPKIQIKRTHAMINNEWVKGSKTFETLNPATEEKLADVTFCQQAEVDEAVKAAHDSFYGGELSKMGGYQRGIVLNRLADLIEKHRDELALLETMDNGKPIGESRDIDTHLAVHCYRYYAGWADKIYGSSYSPSGPMTGGHHNYTALTVKEPVGVVGQIIPFNFPMVMQAWKLAPAFATGCSVVMKPAEQTPLTSLRIAELAIQAGFPKGALNIIPGDAETGKLLATHKGIDKIAFTGSTEVGIEIMKNAAIDIRRVTLELGGKSPLIIMDDANIDKAVETAHVGLFFNQGQCCCASSRIFVHEKVYDQFVKKSVDLAKQRKIGHGWEKDVTHGPQVSKEQQDKVLGLINSGKQQGAKLLLGGGKGPFQKGYFVQPTVFTEVQDNMTIAKEEIFGPVMSVLKFRDVDEVIKRSNNTQFGLAAAIFSNNYSRAQQIGRQLRAGTVWINCYDVLDAGVPFGGFKRSGLGRELGVEGLNTYLETKAVVLNQQF